MSYPVPEGLRPVSPKPHDHRWQPGPLLPTTVNPDERVLLVCECGEVRVVKVPHG